MAENLLGAISATLDAEWFCHFVGPKSRFLLMGGERGGNGSVAEEHCLKNWNFLH